MAYYINYMFYEGKCRGCNGLWKTEDNRTNMKVSIILFEHYLSLGEDFCIVKCFP